MNVRKPVDYGTMYRELTAILAQNLPQMDEIHAIGKAISQRPEKGAAVAAAEFLQANFPDHTGFSPRNVRRMRDFYRVYENDQTLFRSEIRLQKFCGHDRRAFLRTLADSLADGVDFVHLRKILRENCGQF